MQDLKSFLNNNHTIIDIFLGQCPFCKTNKSSLICKSSANRYKCFKCNISGDIEGLKLVFNAKIAKQKNINR